MSSHPPILTAPLSKNQGWPTEWTLLTTQEANDLTKLYQRQLTWSSFKDGLEGQGFPDTDPLASASCKLQARLDNHDESKQNGFHPHLFFVQIYHDRDRLAEKLEYHYLAIMTLIPETSFNMETQGRITLKTPVSWRPIAEHAVTGSDLYELAAKLRKVLREKLRIPMEFTETPCDHLVNAARAGHCSHKKNKTECGHVGRKTIIGRLTENVAGLMPTRSKPDGPAPSTIDTTPHHKDRRNQTPPKDEKYRLDKLLNKETKDQETSASWELEELQRRFGHRFDPTSGAESGKAQNMAATGSSIESKSQDHHKFDHASRTRSLPETLALLDKYKQFEAEQAERLATELSKYTRVYQNDSESHHDSKGGRARGESSGSNKSG